MKVFQLNSVSHWKSRLTYSRHSVSWRENQGEIRAWLRRAPLKPHAFFSFSTPFLLLPLIETEVTSMFTADNKQQKSIFGCLSFAVCTNVH